MWAGGAEREWTLRQGEGSIKSGENKASLPSQTLSGQAGNQASSSEEMAKTSSRINFTRIPKFQWGVCLKCRHPGPPQTLINHWGRTPGSCILNTSDSYTSTKGHHQITTQHRDHFSGSFVPYYVLPTKASCHKEPQSRHKGKRRVWTKSCWGGRRNWNTLNKLQFLVPIFCEPLITQIADISNHFSLVWHASL